MLNRVPLLVWFLVPTLILIGVGVWFFSANQGMGKRSDSDLPDAVSKPVEGTQDFQIVGRVHIPVGTAGSGYNSNPPTSGNHWEGPSKNGVYDKSLPDEQLIHNLEHGYVWISYRPANASLPLQSSPSAGLALGISEEELKQLEEIVKKDDWKIVMAPREKNDSKIALAAWGRLLKMDEPNYDKIRDFIRTYRNRGPEKTPD